MFLQKRKEFGLDFSFKIEANQQYLNILSSILLLKLFKSGKFFDTWLAPGGPEIYD
jgi:hypothetical protein